MEQGSILIRRVQASDRDGLLAFYRALSPESRATRFMGATRGISPEQARDFASAPWRGGDGFVAVERATGEIVGHLYLEPIRAGREEVAVATADRLRGMGIARSMLKAAIVSGRNRRTRTFEATMLTGNRGIHRLLQRAGIPWRRRTVDFGTELLTMDIEAAAAA
ncbi:MAG: GNAT family N-acetyltransferase [Chloroflexota bacterium]|nr:GNAT family N-acetyltransferase [Chloroflexota bacterium]